MLGNPLGRFNDTCLYEVEFSGGEIIELAANIIEELINAQCG